MAPQNDTKRGSKRRTADLKKVAATNAPSAGAGAKGTAKRARERKAEKNNEHQLLRVLVQAESSGIIRWVLKGAAAAFRELQKQREGAHDLPPYRLYTRRAVIASYVTTLLRDFDALTLVEIIADLLFQFRITGTKCGNEHANQTGLAVQREDLAPIGILLAMRHIADLYCEAAVEMPETFGGELAIYTAKLVETLNVVATEQPEHVRDAASGMIAWPIMASAHYPKRSDFNALAEHIHLGATAPVRPRERQTWKPHTPINRYVLDMLIKEGWGDHRPLTKKTLPYYLDEVLMPLFDKVATELGGWENYPEFASIAQKAATRGKAGVQRSEIRNRVSRALQAFTN